MQNQPSHWRKSWPEGAVDNADGDAEVLSMFLDPPEKKKKKKEPTFEWSFDEDVTTTQASLDLAEKMVDHKLTDEATKDGGLHMINVYDNTKRQFERNTPFGNKWWPAENSFGSPDASED